MLDMSPLDHLGGQVRGHSLAPVNRLRLGAGNSASEMAGEHQPPWHQQPGELVDDDGIMVYKCI